jgi:hypothetical protein
MFFKNLLFFLLFLGTQSLFAPEDVPLFIITDEVAQQKLSDKFEGFSADTLVRVPDGYKKISELLIGDSVLSFDFENCKNSISVVTGFFCTVSDTSTKLHLTNEDTNISELLVLDEKQRFLRENLLNVDDPWIMAKDCEKQNLLSLSQSLLKSQVMASSSKHIKPEKLYSIEVRPHNNYFVTKQDLLTHNIIIEGLMATAVGSLSSAGGFGLGHLAAIASWIFGAYKFNENTIKIADEKRQLDYKLQDEQL